MLGGVRVVTLAPNIPGPVAAARLVELGATVVKVEPPLGDPLTVVAPRYYAALHAGIRVERLDLKSDAGRVRLDAFLADADVLLTSSRPSALGRLGLAWEQLHARFPRLVHVAIVGEPAPDDERAGHDLTYVAQLGLLEPPAMPRTLLADLAGAERAVSAALALLLRRERGLGASRSDVALRDAARVFAGPLEHGLTKCGGWLGGGFAGYRTYRARDGWIAVAALEPHFWKRLRDALAVDDGDAALLEERFAQRDASAWEMWARERDLPIVAVRTEQGEPV